MHVSQRLHAPSDQPRAGAAATNGSVVWTALSPVVLAAFVTAIPIFFHLTSQGAAIAACVGLGIIVAGFALPAAPIVIIFAYVFQNFFVALVSPSLGSM